MSSTVPPMNDKIATPIMEVATVGDLWRLSDHTGVPACTLFRALDQLERTDTKRVG